MLEIIFWVSLSIIFYSYIGYGLILFLLVTLRACFIPSREIISRPPTVPVTLIVAAFNEESFIHTKIWNTRELEYPPDKLSVIFITDGSTDQTADILRSHSNFLVLHEPLRKGKSAALNRALQYVKSPVVIFCDANTLLNKECILEITKHYADPKVGGVAGEKKIKSSPGSHAASAGEGIYWRYESLLKKLDSSFYSVVGAAGELFSMRTHLFQVLPEDTIIEDFVLSLRVVISGYKIKYEPKAYAIETASASIREEQKRKIRISAGAFQAMLMLKTLFNVFKFPVLSFQYISHRVLRWTLCPVSLVLLLVVNAFLVLHNAGDGYWYFLILQMVLYSSATAGWILASKNISVKALYVPYYFLFMNFSVFIGLHKFLCKKQTVLWDKALRQE
ncbi:MAG: glycosyltransferase family 2 protein [Chitinophagaceae bacterium]